MVKIQGFSVLILILVIFSGCESKIEYVGVTFRHGARYPSSGGYDIYDSNQTRELAGRLTSVGMRQLYLLGSYMKNEYIDGFGLVNVSMFNKEIEVFSDSTQRCVESGICFVLGLFPFGTGPRVPENLSQGYLKPPFQSFLADNLRKYSQQRERRFEDFYGAKRVEQFSKQIETDFGLKFGFQPASFFVKTNLFQCSGENALVSKKLQELKIRIRDFGKEEMQFINRMKLIFDLKQEYVDLIGMTDLYDLVVCDSFLGRKLPRQFSDEDMKHLTYIQAYLYPLVYSDTLAGVFATPILLQILSNMNNVIKNGVKEVKRLSIYSGHDTNIVALMSYLNLTSAECVMKKWRNESYDGNCGEIVPFGSNMIFQLHFDGKDGDQGLRDIDGFYVKIRYNGEYMYLCERKQKECLFKEFEERVRRDFVDMGVLCPLKGGEGGDGGLKGDDKILILSE